ncbi:hypothetical protein CRYUN_Cryun13aG0142700 [Craigia yunnanensis]
MELGCIDFILVMFLLGSGLMGSVMDVERKLVRMAASMWGSSSGVSSMGLAIIISEMGTYFGEYFSDKMHGFGVYQFGNGHRYEGAWHEGRRQGFGTYTFRNGETQSGHWENGVLDVLSPQNTHLGSPYAVTQSRVLNAVQEARRAAEKADNIAKIDERVNKAVSAANKAANAARVVAVKAVQKRMLNHNSDDLPTAIV